MFKIQKMDFLIAVYIFCVAAAELMGGKTFPLVNLFGQQYNASVAIFFIPLIFSINDIIIEVHGKERARSLIRTALFVAFLVFVFSILFTSLPPSVRFAANEDAYDTVFGLSARFAAASLTALALAEFLDVYVFSKIRERLGKSRLWLRVNLSNIIAQFIDTVVFITLAFYALDQTFAQNLPFLWSIILPYWLIKCTVAFFETPLVYLGVKWLKKDK